MKTCCDKSHLTQYCPDCGQHLGADPLLALLQYVRGHAHRQRLSLERCKEDDDPAYRIKRQSSTVKKWESWAKALEAVIPKEPTDA